MAQPNWTLLRLVNRCLRNMRKPTITDVKDPSNHRIAQDLIDVVKEEYQELCSRQDWHWLRDRAYIPAVAETTDNATFTNGSTLVTGMSAFDASWIGRKLKTDPHEEEYTIQPESSSLTMILDREYVGDTSGASGTSYTVYQDEYDLEDNFMRFILVNKYFADGKIELVGIQEFRRRKFENTPYVAIQGSTVPRFGTLLGTRRVALWPWPKDAASIPYEFIREPAELANNGDTFEIPNDDITLLIHAVMRIMFGYIEDDTRASIANQLFNEKYNEMSGSKTSIDDVKELHIGNRDRARFRRARRGSRASYDFGETFDRSP